MSLCTGKWDEVSIQTKKHEPPSQLNPPFCLQILLSLSSSWHMIVCLLSPSFHRFQWWWRCCLSNLLSLKLSPSSLSLNTIVRRRKRDWVSVSVKVRKTNHAKRREDLLHLSFRRRGKDETKFDVRGIFSLLWTLFSLCVSREDLLSHTERMERKGFAVFFTIAFRLLPSSLFWLSFWKEFVSHPADLSFILSLSLLFISLSGGAIHFHASQHTYTQLRDTLLCSWSAGINCSMIARRDLKGESESGIISLLLLLACFSILQMQSVMKEKANRIECRVCNTMWWIAYDSLRHISKYLSVLLSFFSLSPSHTELTVSSGISKIGIREGERE